MSKATEMDLGALMRLTLWWNEHRRQRGKSGRHRSLGLSTYEWVAIAQVGR